MRIALICPSNMLYMPYVNNYEHILIEQNIDYDIINWDRFQMEEIRENTYRDNKKGHQRGFHDYLKYKKFLMNRFDSSHYDKIIVFGIQLSYFLNKILRKKYKENYIIDIRDHNKIFNFLNFEELIECSAFTVLSSPGYLEWLPESNKYVINHNTQIKSINELREINNNFDLKPIHISNIGSTRDVRINKFLMKSLKNSEQFEIKYHGESNEEIRAHSNASNIKNIEVTGRYLKGEERTLYESSHLINVLRYNDSVNNKTALPNRLYNALIYGKPLLAYEGTYLAKLVSSNNIGLVLNSFDFAKEDIIHYVNQMDTLAYNKGREKFMGKVIQENKHFKECLLNFVKARNS